MRRLWIGVILLCVLLAGGVGMLLYSHHFYRSFSDTLEQAADAALAEDWTAAQAHAHDAEQHWLRHRRFLASFTDHEPVEEIALLLSRLALFEKARLSVDFADTCRSLSGEGWNVLLSPACASFDMFSDYEARGRIFKQIVNELK